MLLAAVKGPLRDHVARVQTQHDSEPGGRTWERRAAWRAPIQVSRRAASIDLEPDGGKHPLAGPFRKPHLLPFTSSIEVWRRGTDGQWARQLETRTISIVPLHMKSNYGGVTVNRRVRAKEAETLCNAIDAIRGDQRFDPSLMMLGDTNILRNDEPAVETFVSRGFIDLNNNDATTYWSKDFGESPFDRIFLNADRPEFRYSRQYVLRSSDLEQHDRFLSDHYMIKVSVKDYVDDADPR
jgi:hypothetical protein